MHDYLDRATWIDVDIVEDHPPETQSKNHMKISKKKLTALEPIKHQK